MVICTYIYIYEMYIYIERERDREMYLQVWKLGFKQTSWRGDWGEGSGAATAQHASCEHIECKLRQNHGAKVSLDVVIMLVSLFLRLGLRFI